MRRNFAALALGVFLTAAAPPVWADACSDLKSAAAQGQTAAMRDLGTALVNGNACVDRDVKSALDWLEKAAAADDPAAQHALGDIYFTGALGLPDYPRAKEWYLKAGTKGYGLSQLRLGFLNAENHFEGLTTDLAEAEKWFTMAALQNAGDAQFRLGNFYHNYKTPPDYTRAFEWLRKAAEGGHRVAQFDLANFYREGKGTPVDNALALEWMQKAADAGVLHAQIALAQGYEKGDWLPKDAQKSFNWAMKIASRPTASVFWTNKVGDALYQGSMQGVPKNYPLAFRMYSKGLRSVDAHATARLGIMTYEGLGVPADKKRGIELLKQSDNAEARDYLSNISKN